MVGNGFKVLVIGCGAAGSVVVKTCAKQPDFFKHIFVASRTYSKCEALKKELDAQGVSNLSIYKLDADIIEDTLALLKHIQVDLVINMALPYQDLAIMEACLQTQTAYIDTANYEPKDEAKFCYKWQWDYHDRFKAAQTMALLGCGFDPGVTNVFVAYAHKHVFDSMHTLDIIDCNDGDHGQAFATNFNPEINIREITQKGKYFELGAWVEIDPLSVSKLIDFPEVGPRKAYLLYHEELESLVKHFPTIQKARFWMTFSESYITHLTVLQNVGMTAIKPIKYQGQDIVPLQFLKYVLPEPASLAKNYHGKTSIGCIISGIKAGREKTVLIYNITDHVRCYQDVQAQAVSYTTGVPAVIAAKLVLAKHWHGHGVFNIEEMDPDPFMSAMADAGLPWQLKDIA